MEGKERTGRRTLPLSLLPFQARPVSLSNPPHLVSPPPCLPPLLHLQSTILPLAGGFLIVSPAAGRASGTSLPAGTVHLAAAATALQHIDKGSGAARVEDWASCDLHQAGVWSLNPAWATALIQRDRTPYSRAVLQLSRAPALNYLMTHQSQFVLILLFE